MSEQEIVDQIESIQTLCGQIANSMDEARKQGRMMTLEEARRMDELSMELKKGIDEVGPDPFEGIVSPLQRNRMGELLGEIRSTLLSAVEPSAQSGIRTTARVANAPASSLKAYKAY
ncbi:MAG: hypothetical protein JXR23_07330 [Pontiellaceae bacterium]|nr:hypothetical protein [Pontiellaceae bacterium]